MRIGYLVNRYPAVSHTFIRREIEGVEAGGAAVRRFSVRPVPESELVDSRDREERGRTEVLLGSVLGLAAELARSGLTRPWRFLAALRAALDLGRRSIQGRLRHLAYLAEACRLARLLRRDPVDHLHAHFGTNPAAVALLCRLLGGPTYSFTVHGPEEFDRPESLGLSEKIRHAAFVVAVSEFGRGQLTRWTEPEGWPKVHVVRCGVDASFLGASPPPGAERRLVCVGRLCTDKGQVLLVDAIARLRREGIPVETVLVGDGPLRPAVEARIREQGLEGAVALRGWMDGAGVRREILGARGFVLPSLAEGLPVVIMEALALGRPVISTYIAGIPELVKPGVNGWLVPSGSVDSLTGAIREILDASPERLREMGEAGARIVAERHDSRVEAGRLLELFRAAAAAGKTG